MQFSTIQYEYIKKNTHLPELCIDFWKEPFIQISFLLSLIQLLMIIYKQLLYINLLKEAYTVDNQCLKTQIKLYWPKLPDDFKINAAEISMTKNNPEQYNFIIMYNLSMSLRIWCKTVLRNDNDIGTVKPQADWA